MFYCLRVTISSCSEKNYNACLNRSLGFKLSIYKRITPKKKSLVNLGLNDDMKN